MGEKTAIQWTDRTYNHWYGCTKWSKGCSNCYAEAEADHRWGRVKWGKGQPRVLSSAAYRRQPYKWDAEAARDNKQIKVFAFSWADVFDAEVDPRWRDEFFATVVSTPNLTWQLLTKRVENILPMSEEIRIDGRKLADHFPLPNVWWGASVEDQEAAWRIRELARIPSRVHFLSLEPLLGPVSLHDCRPACEGDVRSGHLCQLCWDHYGIQQVIVGGESGSKARECLVNNVRSVVRQCREMKIACFVKQLGANAQVDAAGDDIEGAQRLKLRLSHHKGGNPEEWPADLQGIREFPDEEAAVH